MADDFSTLLNRITKAEGVRRMAEGTMTREPNDDNIKIKKLNSKIKK
jgi:hypothetical protein